MCVVIASGNPVKRRATLEAVKVALGEDEVDSVTVDVASGVPQQPVGDEETLRGARNRAEAARQDRPNANCGSASRVV